MKIIVVVLFLTLPMISEAAQPCDGAKGLLEIGQLYDAGYFDQVLEKAETLEDCTSLSEKQFQELLVLKYKCLRNIRKGKNALATLEKLKAFKEANNIPIDFETQLLLAEVYALRGKKEEHTYYIQKIEDSILSNPQASNMDLGRFYLIMYYGFEQGQSYGDALTLVQKALSYFQKMEVPPIYYKGNALRGLGSMNRNQGDFDKSLSYYQQELKLYETIYGQDHFEIAVSHFNIGNVHYEKLEYKSALDHYLKTQKIWAAIFERQDPYMKMLNEALGDMFWELDDHENALRYFNESMLDEPKINNDTSENTLKVADSVLQTGNYSNAIDYYKEAFKWRQKTFGKDHSLTGACKNFVARAVRSSGNTREALSSYQEAIGILVAEITGDDIYKNPTLDMQIRSYQYLLESLMAKGELLNELFEETQDMKDLTVALETNETAIQVLEKMKKGHMSETSKVFWTQRTLSLIENSIKTAIQLHLKTGAPIYLEKAFIFSEKSKALLLLASLDSNEDARFANIPDAIITEEKTLKTEITAYLGKMENEEKRCTQVRSKMLLLYQKKLQTLQSDYDLLLNQIKAKYPDYYDLKHETKIATLAEVRAQLPDTQTTLLSYFVGDQNSYVFRITHDDISVRLVEKTGELQENVSSFFNLIHTKSSFQEDPQDAYEQFAERAFELYQRLLLPELANSESNKLIIIPDGLLSYLPFELLLTQPSNGLKRDYKTLPYLLKQYAISYSPSATVKVKAAQTFEATYGYLGFAPQYDGALYSEERKTLSNLQFNSSEVAFATQLFNGKSWIGKHVTEETLKKRSGKAGIIHLAMHGEVEDEHPLLSRLYFNPSQEEDGLLYTYEIYNMSIPAQLVILSACNTAAGKLERGEGILSLERAFQYAGSKALLSTLWTVDDAASAELTQNFLKNLKAGKTKDVALQEAKLQFLNSASPDKLHPFYWSSFKLTGNTAVLSEKSNFHYLWLGLGILGLAAGIYFFRKKVG